MGPQTPPVAPSLHRSFLENLPKSLQGILLEFTKKISKSRGMRCKSRSIVEKILSKNFQSPGAWYKTFTFKIFFQVQGHGEKNFCSKINFKSRNIYSSEK